MGNGNLIITKESEKIFHIKSDFSYFMDGTKINMKAAFNYAGNLSNMEARRISTERYIIVNPVAIGHEATIEAAKNLQIGETATVPVKW